MIHSAKNATHRLWSPSHAPSVYANSGDVIEFETTEASGGQFTPSATAEAVVSLDWDQIYPLAGPIYVTDAAPGDTLEVEFLDMDSADWGWTAVIPELGLLPDDFPDAHLHTWDLTEGEFADYLGIARIPIRPFCGLVGVCPDIAEPIPVLPPGKFGGNVDCRDLTTGSKIFLPVEVPGALLSLGDSHAAQGDGEVCVSAIEASMTGAVRVTLHKELRIPGPQFLTNGPLRPMMEDQGYFATMGIGPDLMVSARDATRAMIDHMGKQYGLEPIDAYVLCSTVVDLKITEVVDTPNWIVSAYLPLSVMC
ncbi:acetamidase/formamidase family protein [Rhodococcus sp. NPDC060176]|uniref:acetamidase/formamidase family protein n=1 Tax=Rhodococcus sp. NPDC060176 TaxID=3347062 RepID=UPI0036687C8B